MGRYSIGVDIGGTFTDCVVREEESPLVLEKAFTTPGAIGEGVVQCPFRAGLSEGSMSASIVSAQSFARWAMRKLKIRSRSC